MSAKYSLCTQIEGATVAATVSVAAAGAVVLVTVASSAGSGAAVGAVSLTHLDATFTLVYHVRDRFERDYTEGSKSLQNDHGLSGV